MTNTEILIKHYKDMLIRLNDNLKYWQNEDAMKHGGFGMAAHDCTKQLKKVTIEIETAKALYYAILETEEIAICL